MKEPIDTIIFSPIDLLYQKPTRIGKCFISLFDTHLEYNAEFDADEPVIDEDPSSGWQNVHNSFKITGIKQFISGLEKSLTQNQKWKIMIMVSGFPNDIKIYFKTEAAAQKMYERLYSWLFSQHVLQHPVVAG